MIVLINRHCFWFEFIILRTWSNLVKHINKRRRHWFITFALESCVGEQKKKWFSSKVYGVIVRQEQEKILSKKGATLKALNAAKNKISRPGFPPGIPALLPCVPAAFISTQTMGKSLHTIAHRNVYHYLSSFTMREWPIKRLFWRPKVRSFSASPFFAANVLRRQNHGQRGIFVHQTLPKHLHIGGRTNM